MRAMDRNSRRIMGLTYKAGEVRAVGLLYRRDVEQQLAEQVGWSVVASLTRVDLGSYLDACSHLYIGPRNRHCCAYPPSVA